LTANSKPTSRYRLSNRHFRFVDEYMINGNATHAAISAGYSERRARQTAHELLKREDIQAEIAARQARVSKEVDIGVKDILAGLHKEATLTGDGSTQGGRVSAWMGIAKCLGVEKLVHAGDPDNPIVHEIRRLIVDPQSNGPRGA